MTEEEASELGAPAGLSRDLLGAFLRGKEHDAEQKIRAAAEERTATKFAQDQALVPVEKESAELGRDIRKEQLAGLKRRPAEEATEHSRDIEKMFLSAGLKGDLTAAEILSSPENMTKFLGVIRTAVGGKAPKAAKGGGKEAAVSFKTREEVGEAFKTGKLTKDQAMAELKRIGK